MWQRKHRQYQEDRCTTYTEFNNFEREEGDEFNCWDNGWDDDLRESFCVNKNNMSVSDALKNDLECGWGGANLAQVSNQLILLLVIFAIAVYWYNIILLHSLFRSSSRNYITRIYNSNISESITARSLSFLLTFLVFSYFINLSLSLSSCMIHTTSLGLFLSSYRPLSFSLFALVHYMIRERESFAHPHIFDYEIPCFDQWDCQTSFRNSYKVGNYIIECNRVEIGPPVTFRFFPHLSTNQIGLLDGLLEYCFYKVYRCSKVLHKLNRFFTYQLNYVHTHTCDIGSGSFTIRV